MLIITVISNETNELTICEYYVETSQYFNRPEASCRCFIACDSQIPIYKDYMDP